MTATLSKIQSSGARVARVVGHDIKTGMGTLFVQLEGRNAATRGEASQTFPAYYAPPFFGSTSFAYTGVNTGNGKAFQDTQKSYGMSFVPPDIGTKVIVIQVDDTQQWFWMGVIPESGINHMVPGIAAAENVDLSPEEQTLYGHTKSLPVAEINTRLLREESTQDLENAKRPLHPLAGFLLDSGLIGDPTRGTHGSTMRRTAIPNVYGISTPGPLDKRDGALKKPQGTNQNVSDPVFVSRVGGHQFVMDDGDERFVRKTKADLGPPEYADTTKGETGDARIPFGESFRIRTRTGHQILLHNSEDLIYIGNSRGTAWIELTSDGKIDIFAQDSISIHTQQDFNFHAGRDINLEAERNINIKATGRNTESPDGAGATPDAVGRIHVDAAGNLTTLVGGFKTTNIEKDVSTVIKGAERRTVAKNLEETVGDDVKLKATNINAFSLNNTRIRSDNSTNISSANFHRETADKIEMNCDPAEVAEQGSIDSVTIAEPLSLHQNAVVDITLPWSDGGVEREYQSDEPLESIMKRIPQHEPWYKHEHMDPLAAAPPKTDRDITEE